MKAKLREIGLNIRYMDKILLVLIFLFAAFGLVVVFSSSNIPAVLHYHYESTYFFIRQLIFTILGIVVMLAMAIKPDLKASRLFLLFYGLFIAALLGYTFINKITINSSSSWTDVNGISFQPSEFYKSFIVFGLAAIYGTIKDFKKIQYFLLPIGFVVVLSAIVAKEPDLGTAAIMMLITVLVFFSLPIKNKPVRIAKYAILVCSIIGVVLLYRFQPKFIQMETSSRQLGRLAFTEPCSRPLVKTGYQVCNAYIALNNGGLLGRGVGNSTQKFLYLPEAFTDFVFPIVVEEIGVVGSVIVLVAYILLLLKILIIARNATCLKDSIIAFGTFAYILIHILVNLLGVLALLPLTGVPLPFLSYGGSFLLNLFFLLGLTLNVSARNRRGKKAI